jgi:hypothetical protein
LGYATTNGTDACQNAISSPNAYYATSGSTFTAGTVLYTDIGLTTLAPDDYYSDGTTWYLITGGNGTLTGGTPCSGTTTTTTTTTQAPTTTTTTTTTTAVPITCTQWQNLSGISAYYDWTGCDGTVYLNIEILNNGTICAQDGTVSFISGGTLTSISNCTPTTLNLAYSTIDGATACSTYPSTNTYYALVGSSFSNLTTIYTDFALTTLAPNGYYSDGVNYCDITGGTGNTCSKRILF